LLAEDLESFFPDEGKACYVYAKPSSKNFFSRSSTPTGAGELSGVSVAVVPRTGVPRIPQE
jgi:hypothetical protein